MTRGKKNEIDEFVKWMETRHFPLPIKKGDGTTENIFMEAQLRPVQLWEFVFPKENLDVVLNTLKLPHGDSPYGKGDGTKVDYNINPKLWALRKLLKAQKIPVPDKSKGILFMPYERIKNMNILGIGIREDGDIAEGVHERI